MNKDLEKLFQQKFEERTYRSQFNTSRFAGFKIKFQETDLWIGVDPESFKPGMKNVALNKIKELRDKLDNYIQSDPFFKKSLKPFQPNENAPGEAIEMAQAAGKAGIGPMATVAGLFAREVGNEIIQNFSVGELVIENGGDIFALLKKNLVLSVFAGDSPLSERIGLEITTGTSPLGICTSAGTVGPSLSYGKADAVVVVAEDALTADAFATAFGNKVKSPNDVEKVISLAEKSPEILSLLIICEDKIGVRGEFEIKILK
ncbi:hypothetical protein SAMN05444280_12348 [Tangfeifania diversioriginum]|uniref:Uncharacterized protein n=1 Tax=Tangfeifania diversioriginum TaxID=1168035 RepID=A0A1M6KHA3_9BACT|nr:UPF0280 family protein [Tangfeifania diversioriginum]SHJ58318.1 hypothetical protein SAMN05444280_12348 [Tangfeifania diversioriginum]